MAETWTTADQLHPANPRLREATKKALVTQIPESDVEAFLDKVGSASTPAPISATVHTGFSPWGFLYVELDGQPWKYDSQVWCSACNFDCQGAGFIYTTYDSWDAFFQNVDSCILLKPTKTGPLQVSWFIGNDRTPVGQGNFACGGRAGWMAGGSGKWTHT